MIVGIMSNINWLTSCINACKRNLSELGEQTIIVKLLVVNLCLLTYVCNLKALLSTQLSVVVSRLVYWLDHHFTQQMKWDNYKYSLSDLGEQIWFMKLFIEL